MDVKTELNEYRAGRLKLDMLSREALIELVKIRNSQCSKLQGQLERFSKVASHYDRMKQGLNTGKIQPIKDIDIILDLRGKGYSMESIANHLTSMGVEHKATRQTVINRLKKYQDSDSEVNI